MPEGEPPIAFETTRLEVAQAAYPSEVMCRKCRHLMLPADADGATWECWICARRIRVVLTPAQER